MYCDRVSCENVATVMLLFRPSETSAWLHDYDPTSRTLGITLCIDHANRVTVPTGWTITDERASGNRLVTETRHMRVEPSEEADTEPEAVEDMDDFDQTPAEERVTTPAVAEVDEIDEPVADENEVAAVVTPIHSANTSSDDDGRPTLWDQDADGDDADDVDATHGESSDDQDDDDGDLPPSLRVDSSSPMLSRAFRAAHIE
jgi:hypothetical protein